MNTNSASKASVGGLRYDSPEAAVNDEKDGDKEGRHLTGVHEGVRPARGKHTRKEREKKNDQLQVEINDSIEFHTLKSIMHCNSYKK